MITYYGRRGDYLGQTVVVPGDAPLVPLTPVTPVVASTPIVVESPAYAYDDKINLTKAGILVGGIALVALTLTLSSALLRRS